MILIKQIGNFKKTDKFLRSVDLSRFNNIFNKYGAEGVRALSSVTPVDSGLTSSSWSYKINTNSKGITISWTNSNIINGIPIAVLIQYGHGTKNGGYVQGRDYINPAIRPIFDRLTEDIWREVQAL